MSIGRLLCPPVVAMALAVGCGGDEPSGDGTPREDPPDQASEYHRRGNALCVAQIRAMRRIPPPATEQELGEYFEKVLRVERRFDPRFRALEPPPKLRRLHRRLIRFSDRHRPELRRVADRLKKSRTPAITLRKELTRLAPLVDRELVLIRQLGLKKCAELGSPGQATPQGA